MGAIDRHNWGKTEEVENNAEKDRLFNQQLLNTVKNIWVNYHGLPKKKLAFTDHLVIFTK